MGTRGALGFVLAGNEKITYNQYDSYPDGLGEDVLSWLRAALGLPVDVRDILAAEEVGTPEKVNPESEARLRRQVERLAKVPDREPTGSDREQLAEFTDRDVSTGEDWYALLRRTQGEPERLLRAGLYEDASEFPLDSLFCEWAYVVDLDTRQFEVYRGFQVAPPTAGRWVGKQAATPAQDWQSGGVYYPVALIHAWSFDELPAPEVGALAGATYEPGEED